MSLSVSRIILYVLYKIKISFVDKYIMKYNNDLYILLVMQDYQFYLLICSFFLLAAYSNCLCYHWGLIISHLPLQYFPDWSFQPVSSSYNFLLYMAMRAIILVCKSNHATPRLNIYQWLLNM